MGGKIVSISFVFALLFCALSLSAQDSAALSEPAAAVTEQTPIASSTQPSSAESALVIPAAGASSGALPGAPSTFGLFIRMIVVLLLVAAAIYALFYFVKAKVNPSSAQTDPYLKHVSSLVIAVGKTVHIVTLGEKAYLLGASDNSLNLLAEIGDKELVDAMNLHAEENAANAASRHDFASLLQSFQGKKKAAGSTASDLSESLSGSVGRISENLRASREKLRDGGTY